MQQLHTNRPLRIALLDSWLQSAADGSGTAVGIGGLEAELRRQGHRVERIAPPATGSWMRMPITLRRLVFNLLLPFRFQHDPYDLIVGFDWDGVWLPRCRPYICSIKGIVAEERLHERGRIRFLFWLLSKLEGANARRADRVITTSDYCRRKIVEHYDVPQERIGIVPEGIELGVGAATRGLGAGGRGVGERHHTIHPAPLVVLCVARQYPRKHIADLIEAWALIQRRVPHARLRIVGDGPEHSKLVALAQQRRIADTIVFTGSIGDEAVKKEYARCDLFCLPSVQEGFGIVFLEAMASGKAIVSTTAAAIGEVVQHGETGVLVPPGDVHALAGALLFLLGNDDIRIQYGNNGLIRVQRYAWQYVAEQFVREAEQILS